MANRRRKQKSKKLPNAVKKVDIAQNSKLISMDKRIRKMEREPELKYVDEYTASALVSSAIGIINTPLSPNPIQGIDSNQRIGDEIYLTNWHIKGHITNQTTMTTAAKVRVIVFWDKQYTGLSPPILKSTSEDALLDNLVIGDPTFSPYNQNTLGVRYKILKDKLFTIVPQVVKATSITTGAVTDYCTVERNYSWKIPLNRKVKFGSTTSALSDLIGPQPLIIAISDQSVMGFQPNHQFAGRMFFRDP